MALKSEYFFVNEDTSTDFHICNDVPEVVHIATRMQYELFLYKGLFREL